MTSRFDDTTATTSNNSKANTTGVGVNLQIGGEAPQYVGMFINIQKGSIMEQLVMNDDGSYDLALLGKLLVKIGQDGELYMTGQKRDKAIDKQSILEKLFS